MVRRVVTSLGGTVQANAEITRTILSGQRGPKRDIVLLNAAAVLVAGGKANDLKEGLMMAAESIDNGHALAKVTELAKMSQGLA